MIVTNGDLAAVIFIFSVAFVAWAGTLTWKISASLTSIGDEGKQNQAFLVAFWNEARRDMDEMRREVHQINRRLNCVENYIILSSRKKINNE